MSLRDFVSYINTTPAHRVAVFLFIMLVSIGLGVGLSVSSTNAREASDADYSRRLAIFSHWQMVLTSHFTKANALAATIGSFATATATVPANLSAPALARMKYLDQDAFNRMGKQIFISGVTSMVLAPGGVITQFYLPRSAYASADVFTDPGYAPLLPILLTTPGALSTGPSKLIGRAGYGIHVWYPVHVSNITSAATFWGVALVMMEVTGVLVSLNMTAAMAAEGMDYVMWYTTAANGSAPTVIAESRSSATGSVMRDGMRMNLPISEAGRSSYLAIYPVDGPISQDIPSDEAARVAVITVVTSALIVLLVYIGTFFYFCFRHRNAPPANSIIYVAALALRGAQPVADRDPLAAVQMFSDFKKAAKQLAHTHGCYPVCDIGDRCVYVVAKNPEVLLKAAQAAVINISIRGIAVLSPPQPADNMSRASQLYNTTPTVGGKSFNVVASHVSEDLTTQDPSLQCHPSVACHILTTTRVYDSVRDVYFYGTSSQLGKLCSALDVAKWGEVCWTNAFDSQCQSVCSEYVSTALTSTTVSEHGEVQLHVASWWKDNEGDKDFEDPSTAMAALSDAYVLRMTAHISESKGAGAESGERQKKATTHHNTRSMSSDKGEEATALSRAATLLHLTILRGADKAALEAVRRIVYKEKGTIISAHDTTIVAAFNLLSAGGHHQIRAADTVVRLREELPSSIQFVCSIQNGKVNALIMEDFVMCTGDVVQQGKALLQKAVALAQSQKNISVDKVVSESSEGIPDYLNGLCLLCCHNELSAVYDCEAVDVMATIVGGKAKVVYRLATRRSGKTTDDEWMYRLKDEEGQNPFAVVNSVFAKIAAHDILEANRIWREHESSVVAFFGKEMIEQQLLSYSATAPQST